MATPKQVEQWLAQADADLAAAEVEAEGLSECHGRYWLQQSYEKAIKAWGLLTWKSDPGEERQFHDAFLRRHSPLSHIEAAEPPTKNVRLLQRQARAFVNRLAFGEVLLKLDGTTPEFDETKVSYRYPFVVNGEHLAPSNYQAWDGYQGESGEVRRAIRNLIREVRGALLVFKRKPS